MRWGLPPFLQTGVDYSKRVWGLDLVRAIAVLQVIYVHGATAILNRVPIELPPIYYTDGVQIFFVLSGFLIGGILLQEIERPDWGLGRLFNFLSRRWLRTLPLYFLILLLNALVVYYGIIHGDIRKFSIAFFTFTYNLFRTNKDFFWEAWSLSIEEWFYILFSSTLFILILRRYTVMTRKVIALLSVAGFIAASAAIRTYSAFDPTSADFTHAVVYRLDSPVYGILGAFVFRYLPMWWARLKYVLVAIGVLLITHPHTGISFFDRSFYGASYSLAVLSMFPLLHSIKQNQTWFGKVITHISLISYSAYLINLGLTAAIIADNIPATSIRIVWLSYALYWFLVIFNSTLLYKYFEKPIMDRRPKSS